MVGIRPFEPDGDLEKLAEAGRQMKWEEELDVFGHGQIFRGFHNYKEPVSIPGRAVAIVLRLEEAITLRYPVKIKIVLPVSHINTEIG